TARLRIINDATLPFFKELLERRFHCIKLSWGAKRWIQQGGDVLCMAGKVLKHRLQDRDSFCDPDSLDVLLKNPLNFFQTGHNVWQHLSNVCPEDIEKVISTCERANWLVGEGLLAWWQRATGIDQQVLNHTNG